MTYQFLRDRLVQVQQDVGEVEPGGPVGGIGAGGKRAPADELLARPWGRLR